MESTSSVKPVVELFTDGACSGNPGPGGWGFILRSEGAEREGYVPNVVYSCGSLLHGGELILPFAVSDRASAIASIPLDDLLTALKR